MLRKIRVLGLALCALFAFGAALATAADADYWTLGGEGNYIRYHEEVPFHSHAELAMKEQGVGFSTKGCAFNETGELLESGTDEIRGISGSNWTEISPGESKAFGCSSEAKENCENSTVSIEALNLPWRGELVTTEGKMKYVIKADGKGEPLWSISCTIVILKTKIHEDCGATPSQRVANRSGGSVEIRYEEPKEAELTECTDKSKFEVKGIEEILSSRGSIEAHEGLF